MSSPISLCSPIGLFWPEFGFRLGRRPLGDLTMLSQKSLVSLFLGVALEARVTIRAKQCPLAYANELSSFLLMRKPLPPHAGCLFLFHRVQFLDLSSKLWLPLNHVPKLPARRQGRPRDSPTERSACAVVDRDTISALRCLAQSSTSHSMVQIPASLLSRWRTGG